jgi:hypothetical protein
MAHPIIQSVNENNNSCIAPLRREDPMPELHDLNRNLSWQSHAADPAYPAPAPARSLDETGFVRLEQALPRKQIREIEASVDAFETAEEAQLREAPAARLQGARAGDIVLFSSLTPYQTGPNLSAQVRKACILQYAPDGVCAWRDGAKVAAPGITRNASS